MGMAGFTSSNLSALLQLAWTIRRSLNDAADASEGVKDLIASIDAFTRVLQSVQALLGRQGRRVPPSLKNAIAHALTPCSMQLQLMKERIDAHQRRVEHQHGPRVWHGYWAACAWSLIGGDAEVDSLTSRLAEQAGVIMMMIKALDGTDGSGTANYMGEQPPVGSTLVSVDSPSRVGQHASRTFRLAEQWNDIPRRHESKDDIALPRFDSGPCAHRRPARLRHMVPEDHLFRLFLFSPQIISDDLRRGNSYESATITEVDPEVDSAE